MSGACAKTPPLVSSFDGWLRGLLIAMMMGAASTSETLVNFYQTTRRYNPEDSHLRTHRRENLKFYYIASNDTMIINE
jgi:hypothetical protein